MNRLIKNFSLAVTIALTLIMGGLSLKHASALNCGDPNLSTTQAIQCGSCQASDCNTDPSLATDNAQSTLERAITLISVIVGVVAVIMLMIGGFRYITSAGDAAKVTAAKNTILYAIIGLVIVALAQLIVKFVIHESTPGSASSSGSSSSTGASSCPGGRLVC